MQISPKYDVFLVTTGNEFEFYATRYGEKWRDLAGDNLVLAMYDKILELEAQIERLKRSKYEI